jgi:hypothetical protein
LILSIAALYRNHDTGFKQVLFILQVIAVRVYNFDDCLEAAEELKQQTIEAKADLKKKGLKF